MSASFVFTLLASLSALVSAWFWFKSSRLTFKPNQFDFEEAPLSKGTSNLSKPTVSIQGVPVATTNHIDKATIEHSRKVAEHSEKTNKNISGFIEDNSSLNVKASFFTACAAFLGGIAALLSQFGY